MANTNYPSATPQYEQNPNNRPTGSKNKNILIGLLAVGLLGTWGYFLYDKNTENNKVEIAQNESSNYLAQKEALDSLYKDAEARLDQITGSNNQLQGENAEMKKKIEGNLAELDRLRKSKNISDADLKRARSLVSELNGQIAALETQVAKLTGENQVLTANNSQLTGEKQVLEQNLQTTVTEKDALASTVDVGSTFSASGMAITPVNEKRNGKEKTTSTAKRVDKLNVSFNVENRIATSGPADLYVIVTAPDGSVVSNSELNSGSLTTRMDGDRQFTTKVPVEYEQGTRKPVSFPIRQESFQRGDYKIEVYHNGFKIGESIKTLKKGGLFS